MHKVKQYRKKPVVIDAIGWDGSIQATRKVLEFMGQNVVTDCNKASDAFCDYHQACVNDGLMIKTLEGQHIASVGDYIIKGVQGEFYPCKKDIFEQTYEPVTQK
jgi:hypothetical protein